MRHIINILLNIIPLLQSKNNKRVWISDTCPFCDYKSKYGKRVFRYQTKLKVGKSFCCGVSFKEKYWLEKIIKEKLNTQNSGFVKVKMDYIDDGLPF